MPKHLATIKIFYKIDNKLVDLSVLTSFVSQEDLEIQSVSEYPSGKELTLTDNQKSDIIFICMEALAYHKIYESNILF